jgi:hypothetical protein
MEVIATNATPVTVTGFMVVLLERASQIARPTPGFFRATDNIAIVATILDGL